jgi:hypothetical protein
MKYIITQEQVESLGLDTVALLAELKPIEPLTQDKILDMAEGCTLQFHDLLAFGRSVEAAIIGEKS